MSALRIPAPLSLIRLLFALALGACSVPALGAEPMNAAEIAALSEMQTLADAEVRVLIDTGYYVSLENLDDLDRDDLTVEYDFIGDGGGTPVIDDATARFRPDRVDLLNRHLHWRGPYVHYQQGRTDAEDRFGYDRGTPLDPWGTPYFLYTPAGRVDPPLAITLNDWGDRFDRYAIVSYGPNLVHGGGDDLATYFGVPPTRLTLTSVSPAQLAAGAPLTLRGYNLAGARVLIDGEDVLGGFVQVHPRELVWAPHRLDPIGEVAVSLRGEDGSVSRAFTVRIDSPPLGVRRWSLFR